MTLRTRPRPPWHSRGTRRLAILRVGVPTLLACVFAAGPIMAMAPTVVPPKAMALVTNVASVASHALDSGHDGHDADGTPHGQHG